MYALAAHPPVQARLHTELAELSLDDANDWDALNRLVYLDALLKEVLRLYTIVPSTGRQTTRPTTIGGRRYCAGVTLWINMYGLAHDSEYFPDPYELRPERWLHQQSETLPPAYSYIPFSGGPHVCIGRKYSLLLMKMLTVRIVRSFRLQLGESAPPLVLQAQMVLRSRDGIKVQFWPRVDNDPLSEVSSV